MNKAWLNPFNPTLKIKTSIVFIGMLFIVLVLKSLLFASSSVGQVDVNRIKGQFIRNLAEHKLSNEILSPNQIVEWFSNKKPLLEKLINSCRIKLELFFS